MAGPKIFIQITVPLLNPQCDFARDSGPILTADIEYCILNVKSEAKK